MFTHSQPPQGLLFGSFLYRSDLFTHQELICFWENEFGKSSKLQTSYNPLIDYYQKEMGYPLRRIFLLTHDKFPRESLLSVKLMSLNWEKQWSSQGKRQVNVDVGLLNLENFILATTKIYSHRIFLGQNIFADLTYQFQNKKCIPLPWTYPDYLDQEKMDFFLENRGRLKLS